MVVFFDRPPRLRGHYALLAVLLLSLFGLCAAGSRASTNSPFSADPEVQAFISDLAERHGFDRARLVGLFGDAKVLSSVLRAISKPAEMKPWHQYRPIFVTRSRIQEGVRFWREHRENLARAESTYGVAPEVVVAILGVETRYGRSSGRFRVLDSLATLAFRYPRRSAFFRRELEQFLLLAREEGLDPAAVKGSYAGAMGLPQFISSSYRRYAVDFDGDEKRDLLGNPADAIGSVANYLSAHGWVKGGQVAFPATVDGNGANGLLEQGIQPHTLVADMKLRGVSVPRDAPDSAKGALIRLQAEGAYEYWVGLQNFYAITRYNHSALYAMAVHQLANAVRERYQGWAQS